MNINSLSFKSKIKFVNEPPPRNLTSHQYYAKGKYVAPPWTAEEFIKADECLTDVIKCCTAGGITDGKNVTMFHLQPSNTNLGDFEKFKEKMLSETDIKNRDKSELNGLIIGGKYNHKENTDYVCRDYVDGKGIVKSTNGRKLFDKIKKFFKETKINHSIIWGQDLIDNKEKTETELYYSAKEDTWFVRVFDNQDKFSFNRKIHKIKTLKDLQKTYRFIKISAKDQLFIDGKEIPRKKLKEQGLTS